jgi:ATP-binding cassette subfamily C protein CydC
VNFTWRLRVLAQLLGFFHPFLGWVVLSVLLGAATVGSGIGLMGASAYLIASAAFQPSIAALQVAIVGVRFFGIIRAFFRYLERLASHSASLRHLARLRAWFYSRLEPLAPAGLQGLRSADLLGRAIADVETLESFYVRAIAPPLSALVVVAGTGWFVGRYDPRLALVLAAALLAAGLGLPALAYLSGRAHGAEVVDKRSALQAHLLDAVQGMPDLLAYGHGEAQLAKIWSSGAGLSRAQWKLGLAGALANALSLLLVGLALAGVLLVAIPLAGSRFDGIALAVLALVTLASFEAVSPLPQAAQHLEGSLQAARRLFEMTGSAPPLAPQPAPQPAPRTAGLCIRDLTFAYLEEEGPALDHFCLDLPPGKHVALVGASGAGKTTLANLLLRLWDGWEGTIELDGCDIRRYDPEDVRRLMAVVSQPTYLFSGTLRQNLLVARPQAGQADLERAIQGARLEELLARLPEGLDAWIGERGMQLSGGERQRVSIARALLRASPLLILDEPAANLDADTARQISDTLRQAGAGRSLIAITHWLDGLEEMDEILVLQDGRVIERGRHADLLAAGGVYARLWRIHRDTLAWPVDAGSPAGT